MQIRQLAATLQAFSPRQTLERGYSILQTEAGEIVRSVDQVGAGDRLDAELYRGKLSLKVDGKDAE